MKIAMFGGSFNPVHNGHIELAKAVHEQAGYDKVLFVPAYHSPFKDLPSGASDEDRLCMLRLALEGFDWAFIEDCELKRGGVSYTYETVEFLVQKYTASGEYDEKRDGKLGLVIGADLAAGFTRWHRAEELAAKVDIILARRKLASSGSDIAAAQNGHDAAIDTADGHDAAPDAAHENAPKMPQTHDVVPDADYGHDAAPDAATQAAKLTTDAAKLSQGLPFAHYELKNPYVDVSSSEIRDAVHAAGNAAQKKARNTTNSQCGTSCGSKSAKTAQSSKIEPSAKNAQSSKIELLALVPERVCDYILERGLYD